MEFPDLGTNCADKSCKQLDFLPMKCDACSRLFCLNHFRYDAHGCEFAHIKDNQVPICPLCNEPVPMKKTETPDSVVNDHIDNSCLDDRAKKKRDLVYKNKCSLKKCKQKELVPLVCSECKLNFCLRHRHPNDHLCQGNKGLSAPGEAALIRAKQQDQKSKISNFFSRNLFPERTSKQLNESLKEDEALARAMQESLNYPEPNLIQARSRPKSTKSLQEEEDRQLAQAIAASQSEMNRNKEKCSLS